MGDRDAVCRFSACKGGNQQRAADGDERQGDQTRRIVAEEGIDLNANQRREAAVSALRFDEALRPSTHGDAVTQRLFFRFCAELSSRSRRLPHSHTKTRMLGGIASLTRPQMQQVRDDG